MSLDPYVYSGDSLDTIEPDDSWGEWVAWRTAHRSQILASTKSLQFKYSDDEARDDHGRFTSGGSTDKTAAYKSRDLHAEGVWPSASKPRYGAVMFNDDGKVLLREPLNHFDGYHWTFAKRSKRQVWTVR